MFQWPCPLKLNDKRKNPRKKWNFFELEVDPLVFEVEFNKAALIDSMNGINLLQKTKSISFDKYDKIT